MSATRPAVDRALLLRVGCGVLFLQAGFNPERRQALGVAAALSPVARLWADAGDRRAFYLRHLDSFNTNPAFAGPILGAVVRLEEAAAAGDRQALARIPRLKRALEGPFASTGDVLLWGGGRPAAGLLGGALGLVAGGWGPILFLAVFNALHLGFRVGGVFWGYARGPEVHRLIRADWIRRAQHVLMISVVVGAALLGYAALGPGARRLGPAVLGLAVAAVGVVLGGRGFARGTLLAVGAMLTGLVAAFIVGAPDG